MSANSEYLDQKDPTLFDGLGPCFGLVQITGSILLRYVLKLNVQNLPQEIFKRLRYALVLGCEEGLEIRTGAI